MKKKLNLLWNLKFNFFSVAERPLTFFAYFLNAKKVGRRRLVIVPATAGGLPLFPHAASVPAPALAPVRSHFTCGETARPIIGPAFWVCRAKAGAAFRCAKPPCAVVRFAAMASPPRTAILPFPSRLRRAGAPTAKPRRLSPFGSISPPAKPRGRSLPPPGATCSLPHFRSAQMWPRARTPALVAIRLHFASGETARPVVAPAGGNVLATPFSLRSNVAPRSHPGAACPVYRTENALFCFCRVFQYLTMQVKAPFY